ncbi:MAG: ImmA/IrrE family metallo-endopeptidase [Bacteroidetes bacterium]|nr:ImmA/IrrE family metallo-endopeptidase [Bacteroidota bacterium]
MRSSLSSIAKVFWEQAGVTGPHPRDISGAVSLKLPIDIICLSDLTLKRIQDWLIKRKVVLNIEVDDRLLHGFILLSRGAGFIFINGTDKEEERRYTIAHEVSHFLLDYKMPRDLAVEKLGKSILEVLNGFREPTEVERIDGTLSGVKIKPYTHLLEKTGDGSFGDMRILESEDDADNLALELLAPRSMVLRDLSPRGIKISFYDFKSQCYQVLRSKYLIPDAIAERYSLKLTYAAIGPPSLVSKLGL